MSKLRGLWGEQGRVEQNVGIGRGFGGETDSFWRCAMSLWVGGRAAQDLQISKDF